MLLFDGVTTKGWMTIQRTAAPAPHAQDGTLNPHPCNYMLVYEQPFENYIVALDFKIGPRCNSGIFVRISSLKPRAGKDVGYNGVEVAIDDTCSAGYHDTGAIYDPVKPAKNAMKAVGEWIHVVITSDRNQLSVELNGEPVSRIDFNEWPEVGKRPDSSTHNFDVAYRDHPRRGYIGVQDHGSDCWLRNIKLKCLP
jgi:hypothetical protein